MVTTKHRQNLEAVLVRDVYEHINEGIREDKAFSLVAAQWLGYELESNDENYTDGRGDRGLDSGRR